MKKEEKRVSSRSPSEMAETLVKHYYSGMGITEWRRLVRSPYGRLEFDTTMYYLKKHLPRKGNVLDAGGGPGRYTIELAKLGYHITLLDLTPELLEIAKRQVKKAEVDARVEEITQGNIYDLSRFKDDTFDAVICLGAPLSHVLNRVKREKAIDELIRVAKKEAPIFVSVIGRTAVLVTELVRLPHEIELEVFPRIRDTGDYHGGYGFAPCHFYTPGEIKESFERRGSDIVEMAGLEGIASGHPRETNRLCKKYPKAWKIWWQTHLKTCTDPVGVGISEHFLIIVRK
jgi:2-polyprenyl-3-methyl-5-hydroxy-6-metoxy-1,4-benzoquinol methylase